MNKREFILALEAKTNYQENECLIISDILEKNWFLAKKNKDKIIKEIMMLLKIEEKEASNIYKIAIDLIYSEIKFKLKNPFKSGD